MNSSSRVVSREELAGEMSRLNCQAIGALGVIALWSLFQLISRGIHSRAVLLFAGSVLSLVSLFAFPVLVSRRAVTDRQRLVVGVQAMTAGFFPYLFGSYLTLYEGLWRGFGLIRGEFTVGRLVVTLISVVAGFWIVRSTHRISVVAQAVRNREIEIRDVGKPGAA